MDASGLRAEVPPLNFARSISVIFANADPDGGSRAHPPELTAAWVAQFLVTECALTVAIPFAGAA